MSSSVSLSSTTWWMSAFEETHWAYKNLYCVGAQSINQSLGQCMMQVSEPCLVTVMWSPVKAVVKWRCSGTVWSISRLSIDGVRQGCVLAPDSFATGVDCLLERTVDTGSTGVCLLDHTLSQIWISAMMSLFLPSYLNSLCLHLRRWHQKLKLRSNNLSLWLRIVHSGDWCLRLALRTPSGACHTRRRRRKRRPLVNFSELTINYLLFVLNKRTQVQSSNELKKAHQSHQSYL